MTDVALVLAHQGGWDEVLLILTPIVIFAALLGLANRRANAEVRRRGHPQGAAGDGIDAADGTTGTGPAGAADDGAPDDGPERRPAPEDP